MRRLVTALLLCAIAALAANTKLYLKDGSYQLVREYKLLLDRVQFYSIERSQWEEIPVELVNLKRTQDEADERKAVLASEAKAISDEDQARREMQREISKIPRDPGVYYLQNEEVKVIKAAECKVRDNKGRKVLKVLSPIPMVPGKSTLEADGSHSENILGNPEQEFYIQMAEEERFGIVRLTPDRNVRIVEKITTIPVSKEIVEEPDEVQVFRKQLTPDGLYRLWPMKPLSPGEYAVVEYTEGKVNMQVYDFAIVIVK